MGCTAIEQEELRDSLMDEIDRGATRRSAGVARWSRAIRPDRPGRRQSAAWRPLALGRLAEQERQEIGRERLSAPLAPVDGQNRDLRSGL